MNDTPSRALTFFQDIQGQDNEQAFAFLSSFPPLQWEETEWLDFKGAIDKDRSRPLSDNQLKRIYSEAASGFANTIGGVLVFGIEAKYDPQTRRDCAIGLDLVQNPQEWLTLLNRLRVDVVSPPLQGIEILAVQKSGGGDGFIVCYIPKSPTPPHRAEMDGKRYVYRAGTSFLDLPVSFLRDLFYPRSVPIPIAEFLLSPGTDGKKFVLTVSLYNEGTMTADEVLLWIHSSPSSPLEFDYVSSRWELESKGASFQFSSSRALHPGLGVRVWSSYPTLDPKWVGDVTCNVTVCGHNIEPVRFSTVFAADEVGKTINRRTPPVPWRPERALYLPQR